MQERFGGIVFDGALGWLGAALALAAVAGLIVYEERRLRSERPDRRRILLGLRVLSGAVVFAIAAQPAFVTERFQKIESRSVVLIDESRSMSIASERGTRAEEARALIERLAETESLELRAFGNETRLIDREGLRSLGTASATKMIAALEELAEDDSIGSVILISDGLETEEESIPRSLDRFPIHTVRVGGELPPLDVGIDSIRYDPIVYLRERPRVSVTLRCTGRCAQPVEVRFSIEGNTVDGALVDFGGEELKTVEFSMDPRKLGRHIGRIAVQPPPGDSVRENDARSFLFRVERERLRVLLVAGAPSWDVRFLRELLERNPALDLVSFFILRTVDDLTMADNEEMALIPFPTDELFREHLGSFDLVIFQNFDYGPYRMAIYLPRIRDYVERGGAFLMIGGEKSFSAGGYAGTAVETILPTSLPPPPGIDARPFSPVPLMPRHPLVALGESPEQVRRRFQELAPLAGANELGALRPGARALLGHPQLRVGGEPAPILAAHDVGEGRVVAFASDSSFRWGITTAGERGDLSVFERFWDLTLRYMVRDKALEPSRLSTDHERVAEGGELLVIGEFRDEEYEPLAFRTVELSVEDEAGRALLQQELTLTREGRMRHPIKAPERGGVHQLIVRDGPKELARTAFYVEGGGEEFRRVRPDGQWLRAIADMSGGVYFSRPDELRSLGSLSRIEERKIGDERSSPFRQTGFIFLALVIFVVELAVRRVFGRT